MSDNFLHSLPRKQGTRSLPSFRRRKLVLGGCFVLWVAVISIPLGLFSASHQAVLPVAVESLVGGTGDAIEGWSVVHVLAEDCPCSRSVMDYLLERGRSKEFSEEVILVDGSEERANLLREVGFVVSSVESGQLCEDFGSEGVPFFQVVEGSSKPAYSGAYFGSAFRGTNGFLDLSTASRLKGGGFVFNRPVYGCATSDRLKAILDPFGLK